MLSSLSRVGLSLRRVPLHSSFYGGLQSSQTSAWLHGQASQQHEHTDERSWRIGNSTAAVLFGGALVAVAAYGITEAKTLKADAPAVLMDKDLRQRFGVRKAGLPEYSLDDVAKHATLQDRVWVSFNNGVYDVTEFVAKHPGGDKILLGAGGSVEPFWTLYAVHKRADVLELLETFRIGNLREDEVGVSTENMSDPYALEPRRHVALKPASKTPFNAEPSPQLLVENLYTPNDLFYVRNHLPVPVVKESEYSLEVCGLGVQERHLSLTDIKKFPKHTITAAVQCGGNRRSEMVKVRPVKGLSWGHAAISNATWSGALLSDVLRSAGFDETNTQARHVQFEGLDLDPTSHPYGASIPLWKAVERSGDVLLAYEMNGETLPRDHGYPLRVIVPGVVGARNVKWLSRIVISEDESDSHWQQNDYKGFAPNVDWDTVDFSKSPAIQEMPVVSAICDPAPGEAVTPVDGKVTVRGYAYSGGGRKIVRVDISSDGGKSWRAVECLDSDAAEHPRAWGWSLWTAKVEVPKGTKNLDLVVKAVDSNYNTQPENFENIWNLRGVLSNAYHRVSVKVK
ncbi:Oxidoreductase molybdopterin-binding domain [Trinorchestia longiramus]|nr:Oxidoreductase molybdopterin-binding domain [Trinorchestia longiramus]